MKNILCFGDSNTWGFMPHKDKPPIKADNRFPRDVRWPGKLEKGESAAHKSRYILYCPDFTESLFICIFSRQSIIRHIFMSFTARIWPPLIF